MFDPSNVVNSAYWFDKPLIYTNHAKERCLDRAILFYDFLPISSKLMDCERDNKGNITVLCFKINQKGDCFIVSHDGIVITVFNCNDKGFNSYVHKKNLRRYHQNYLNAYFGDSTHRLIPRRYAKR